MPRLALHVILWEPPLLAMPTAALVPAGYGRSGEMGKVLLMQQLGHLVVARVGR